jgi:hypothetical protein
MLFKNLISSDSSELHLSSPPVISARKQVVIKCTTLPLGYSNTCELGSEYTPINFFMLISKFVSSFTSLIAASETVSPISICPEGIPQSPTSDLFATKLGSL